MSEKITIGVSRTVPFCTGDSYILDICVLRIVTLESDIAIERNHNFVLTTSDSMTYASW